jgi:hypothetical protein
MAQFIRPPSTSRVYQDDEGKVIDYGRRWQPGDKPAESYSRTSNLDRYEPVQVVARALIDYLNRAYDVVLESGPSCIDIFLRPELGFNPSPVHFLDAVTITPSKLTCAPLTFGFTSLPGLYLRAGVLHDFRFPDCGCDACDEGIDYLLDELEQAVFAVTQGNLQESIKGRRRGSIGYAMNFAGGSESGSTRWKPLRWNSRRALWGLGQSPERIKAAKDRLAKAPNGWTPWPLRPNA